MGTIVVLGSTNSHCSILIWSRRLRTRINRILFWCACSPQTSGLPMPSQTSQSDPVIKHSQISINPECVQTSQDKQITFTPDQIDHSLTRLEQSISEPHCHLTSPPELTQEIHQCTAVANLDVWNQSDLLLITWLITSMQRDVPYSCCKSLLIQYKCLSLL